jgi:hypothetical protein
MRKTILALAAISAIAAGTLTPPPAEAYCHGCAVGAGVAGGLVAGAIIGGAIANSQPHYYAPPPAYAPAPGYVVYNGYYEPAPVGCPGGYWSRRPLYDHYGNQVGWSRPRFICP